MEKTHDQPSTSTGSDARGSVHRIVGCLVLVAAFVAGLEAAWTLDNFLLGLSVWRHGFPAIVFAAIAGSFIFLLPSDK